MQEEYINNTGFLLFKTTKNAIWNISGFLFISIIAFITVPLFISLLGVEKYGLFILFQSIIFGFNIIGLGVGPATVKYVAETISSKDYKMANEYINTTFCLNILIGMIGLILISLLAGPLSKNILNVPIENQIIVQRCFYWIAIGWFILQIQETPKSVLMAFQNFKLLIIGASLSFILLTIIGLGVLYTGGNLVNLVQSNVFVLMIMTIIWWFLARISFSHLKLRIRIVRNLLKKTMAYGLWRTLANIGTMLYNWIDKILIGIFLPAAAIGYYNVPVMLCSKVHVALSRIGLVFFPLISYLQGKDDKNAIYKYFINGSWVISLLATIVYVPLALFGKSFISLWIGSEFAKKSYQLFLIVIMAHLILSASVMRSNFLAGIGKPFWLALGASLSGIIGIFTMVVLIPKFGLKGAGWSYFANAAAGSVITILIKTKFFPEKAWFKILYALYGPVIIGVIIILAGFNITSMLSISSWSNLIFYIAITMLTTFAILLFIDFVLFGHKGRSKFIWQTVKNVIKTQSH